MILYFSLFNVYSSYIGIISYVIDEEIEFCVVRKSKEIRLLFGVICSLFRREFSWFGIWFYVCSLSNLILRYN